MFLVYPYQFFVYCKKCTKLRPGKLRVVCGRCLQGNIILHQVKHVLSVVWFSIYIYQVIALCLWYIIVHDFITCMCKYKLHVPVHVHISTNSLTTKNSFMAVDLELSNLFGISSKSVLDQYWLTTSSQPYLYHCITELTLILLAGTKLFWRCVAAWQNSGIMSKL